MTTIETRRRRRARIKPAKAAAIGRRLEALVSEVKAALARHLRERRIRLHLTQGSLARRLRTSQARVSRIEAADQTVSLELVVRALFATGATRREITRAIESGKKS